MKIYNLWFSSITEEFEKNFHDGYMHTSISRKFAIAMSIFTGP